MNVFIVIAWEAYYLIKFWDKIQLTEQIIMNELHTIMFKAHQSIYSKLYIIRPGRSRFLEFEKKIVLVFNRDFFQTSRPGRLIETKNWLWQPGYETV